MQLLCRYGFVLPESVPTDCILVTSSELVTTYTAFLNDDADHSNNSDNSDDDEATDSQQQQEPAAKKRKLFVEKKAKKASENDDALFFLLHGDQQREFGLGDVLLSFVFAKSLPADALYDVLAVLLRKRDKLYSDALEKPLGDQHQQESAALVQLLFKHERAVCRRILIGIMTLEENSSDEEDEEDEDEGNAESYEDEDDEE